MEICPGKGGLAAGAGARGTRPDALVSPWLENLWPAQGHPSLPGGQRRGPGSPLPPPATHIPTGPFQGWEAFEVAVTLGKAKAEGTGKEVNPGPADNAAATTRARPVAEGGVSAGFVAFFV